MSKVKHMSFRDGDTNRWFCHCGDAQHVFEVCRDQEWFGDDIQITIHIVPSRLEWNPKEWRHNLYVLKMRILTVWSFLMGRETTYAEVIISNHDRQDIADVIANKLDVKDEQDNEKN